MTKLFLARRLRVLTAHAPVCSGYQAPPRDEHRFCLRCGGEEWPHVARAVAELLEHPEIPAASRASSRRDGSEVAAAAPTSAIDVTNTQGVSLNSAGVVVLFPRPVMTPEEALIHAAWLVAVADPLSKRSFGGIYAAVIGN